MSYTTRRRYTAPIASIGRSMARRFGGLGMGLTLAWPWVLLAINRSWIFLNGSFVDSWIYFGFFQNLREYQTIYASANSTKLGFYYDDRLSWILPGYLVYQLFPPLIANYILHIGLYYVVSLALYAILALVVHRRAAIVGTLLMGSYSYFLNAIGWDYIDGAGLAYCALTLLLLTLASRWPRWPLWMSLAGVAAAALVFSNLFWAVLSPSIGLYYLVINRHHSVKRIALGIAPLVAGALLFTGVIALINRGFGGSPFFFASSLEFAAQSANLPTNPWVVAHSDWPITHPYLVWPLIMTLACALWLAIPRLRRSLSAYPQSLAVLVLFLSMSLTMLALNMRGASPILQTFFYASYLIFALFLAIAVILAPLLATLSRARFAGLLGITILATLSAYAFRACGEFPLVYPALPAIVLGLLWLALQVAVPHQAWPYGVFVAAFCVATPSAFGGYAASFATNSFCRLAPQAQSQPEDEYLAVLDGIEAIHRTVPEQRVFFWFNASEQVIYSELSSAYLYTWNQISREFPAIGGRDTSFTGFAPPPGTTAVIASRSPSALADANAALRERSRTLRLLSQQDIHRGAIQFNLLIGVIEAVPEHVALDTTLEFTQPGTTDRFLLGGWWGPDTSGTWSDGPRAELHMLLDRPADQDLEMTAVIANSIGAFVPDPPAMSVNVSVNGVQLDTWKFDAQTKWGQFSTTIPARILTISDTTRISFDIIDPHSPRELGFNYNDIRQMGIEMRSISFSRHHFWGAQNPSLGEAPPAGMRVGRREGDGWGADVAQDPEGFLQYGPYTSSVSPGDHVATWALMIDDTAGADLPIVRLEVIDATAGSSVLASRTLTRAEWHAAAQYQDFTVPFTLPAQAQAHQLEFRVFWFKQASVREQSVSVK